MAGGSGGAVLGRYADSATPAARKGYSEKKQFIGTGLGIVLTEAGRRLAALAREQWVGLEDFRRSCHDIPVEVSLAGGNSLLEWLLMPKIAVFRKTLPGVRLRILSQRTRDTVEGLMAQNLDFGLIRANALRPGLSSRKVRVEAYSLFIPKLMAAGLTKANLKKRIAGLPIATSIGGQFRKQIEAEAGRANWPLNIELSCSSFTQAARAVEAGACAGLLPDVASVQFFKPGQVIRFEVPFIADYARPLVLAWHPRTAAVREIIEPAAQCLAEISS